jgi:hypothetical protein
MAIAASHELLSKQVEDQVSLYQTLEAVVFNFRHIIQSSPDPYLSRLVGVKSMIEHILQQFIHNQRDGDHFIT